VIAACGGGLFPRRESEADVTFADRVGAGTRAEPARVLVAEDNPANQRLVEIILTSLGYRVRIAPDGAEAVRAAETEPFDLILMDIRMPVLDGFEAARAIRRLHGPAGEAPIVAVTADMRPRIQEDAYAAGMNACIFKPIDITALTDLAERWTGGALTPRSPSRSARSR
jgi:CheY-like chemotaxis protein